jgi:hypothetical protein
VYLLFCFRSLLSGAKFLNAPAGFSRSRADFPAVGGDANDLSHFGGVELSRPALAETASNIHRRPDVAAHSGGIGIPEMLKAPLAKSAIRSKIRQCHLEYNV